MLTIGLEPIPQKKREQILSLSCIPISPSELKDVISNFLLLTYKCLFLKLLIKLNASFLLLIKMKHLIEIHFDFEKKYLN